MSNYILLDLLGLPHNRVHGPAPPMNDSRVSYEGCYDLLSVLFWSKASQYAWRHWHCSACCITGLEMPESLPHPTRKMPDLIAPDPPFEYNTYVVNSVKIGSLEWSNPPTKNEGARPTLRISLLIFCLPLYVIAGCQPTRFLPSCYLRVLVQQIHNRDTCHAPKVLITLQALLGSLHGINSIYCLPTPQVLC